MNNKKKYIGAMLLGTLLAGLQGCTDTWDDHYGIANDTEVSSANETLWDIISSDPKLSNFAQLASMTRYYRDEKHFMPTYTFADMLKGTQALTVWAPENDALSPEEWGAWMLLAANPATGYNVHQRIMTNSISLWRNPATVTATAGNESDTLSMLNGKRFVQDKKLGTMAGVPLVADAFDIPAKNGVLHHVSKTLPFHHNLYEFIKYANEEALDSLREVILKEDTIYFYEEKSIEGKPDINGDPTYVDSAYVTTNNMFGLYNGQYDMRITKRFPETGNDERFHTYNESFGFNIAGEDSTIIMLMPTNEAWHKAHEKLKKYYNYTSIYTDNAKIEQGTDKAKRTFDPDSMAEACFRMDMITPLVYNLHNQPDPLGRLGRWKSVDEFLSNPNQAKFLMNTYGDTLQSNIEKGWLQSELFTGRRVPMSNGVAIIGDEWPIPAQLYKPDIYIEVSYRSYYDFTKSIASKCKATAYAFSNEQCKDFVYDHQEASLTEEGDTIYDTNGDIVYTTVKGTGIVSKNNFTKLEGASNTEKPTFSFRLVGTDGQNRESEVMSGKYDIYAVLVPDFYVTSTEGTRKGDVLKHKIQARLTYQLAAKGQNPQEKTVSAKVEYDGESVQLVKLFEDHEFPITYKNLRHSFPILELTSSASSSDVSKNGYSHSFCIDRIILRSKD